MAFNCCAAGSGAVLVAGTGALCVETPSIFFKSAAVLLTDGPPLVRDAEDLDLIAFCHLLNPLGPRFTPLKPVPFSSAGPRASLHATRLRPVDPARDVARDGVVDFALAVDRDLDGVDAAGVLFPLCAAAASTWLSQQLFYLLLHQHRR